MSHEVVRIESLLDREDIDSLQYGIRLGFWISGISLVIGGGLFYAAYMYNPHFWLMVFLGVAGGLGVLFGLWMSFTENSDLKSGKKTILRGRIWDIFEVFETEVSTGNNSSKFLGTRNFYFRVGEVEHRFYDHRGDHRQHGHDDYYHDDMDKFNVGDEVEMHYSVSNTLIRMNKSEGVSKPQDDVGPEHITTYLKHKIKSDRPIFNYLPRKMVLTYLTKQELYYFHIGRKLVQVGKEVYENVPAQSVIRIPKDKEAGESGLYFYKNEREEWVALQIIENADVS